MKTIETANSNDFLSVEAIQNHYYHPRPALGRSERTNKKKKISIDHFRNSQSSGEDLAAEEVGTSTLADNAIDVRSNETRVLGKLLYSIIMHKT